MITAQIGTRIRELRMQTGLSQEKFAQKIGMDRTYFASVELGKRNISIVNIEKIANHDNQWQIVVVWNGKSIFSGLIMSFIKRLSL